MHSIPIILCSHLSLGQRMLPWSTSFLSSQRSSPALFQASSAWRGGMILMGVFGFFLTVPAAMVLHGIAQAFSNGSRVWLYRRHIKWRVLVFYCVGALVVLAAFSIFRFVPDIGLVFILIGAFPFLALLLPDRIDLDMEKPGVSFSSGIVVTTAQMVAGASGPVLDIFYVPSAMNKEEILGTKAITQTFGHILKLIY